MPGPRDLSSYKRTGPDIPATPPGKKPKKAAYRRVPVEVHEAPKPPSPGPGDITPAGAGTAASGGPPARPGPAGKAVSKAGPVGKAIKVGAKVASKVSDSRNRKANRQIAKSLRSPSAKWRTLLVAEFLASMLITQLAPLTDKNKLQSPAKLMTRSSALMGVFLVLALVSTGGEQAAKISAAFGGLVTVTLMVSDRDVFVVLAKTLDRMGGKGPAGPDDPDGQMKGAGEPVPASGR